MKSWFRLDRAFMPQGTLCLANAEKKVLPDHGNRFSVAKVRAVIKMLQLHAKCLKKIVFGKLVHCDERNLPMGIAI